jgi:hypothetical protein
MARYALLAIYMIIVENDQQAVVVGSAWGRACDWVAGMKKMYWS